MAKRKNNWTEAKVKKYIKEGRGQGELSVYQPWLTIQDVPSRGRVHRSMGWKTEREHHLFSDLEFNYFCLSDWANNVIDIREQFPLDRQVTLSIAEEINIKHPTDNKTATPIVMTTDFFLTIREEKKISYKARTIKPSEELNNVRVIEKFEIERIYWEKQGVDWGIVTERDIPSTFVENLKFIKQSYYLDDYSYIEVFMSDWKNFKGNLRENLNAFDLRYNFDVGTGILLYKYALARKLLSVDMNKKISLNEEVENITVQQEAITFERWAK
ncbi:TnsA endonuclease N-terminal domain-containing protein [Priestia megaterium]|uniref:TnsA endonuclease N-terminal domain-containing protein n=1 Tax=Priestia megaterium TaxID=1404 RepID=UPI003D0296BB